MRDVLAAPLHVAEDDLDLDAGRATAACEPRDHAHGLPVDGVEALEVDLALEARVVPPAAGRRAVGGEAGGREIGRPAPGVDADHQPVRAAALEAVEAELERDVGAAVGPDAPAVEPDRGAVVDRLEAHGPLERAARLGQREVLAVPADAADHRLVRVVPEVPHVRRPDPAPAGGARAPVPAAAEALVARVAAEQPRAVHQVATGRALVVEGLLGGLVGRRRAARQGEQQQREQGQDQSQGASHPRHHNTAVGGKSRTHHEHPASSAIGCEIASSSTPPPVSGPSRRACTHCTTGWEVPARQATRPVPERRVIVTRTDGR